MSVFVVINGEELQVDNEVLASKYNDDIDKLDRSFMPHTKDITIPDAPKERRILGYLSDRFLVNPVYRFTASIEKDNQEVFKGDLVILEVEESNAKNIGKYECQLVAGLGTTMEKAKNTTLKEMNFADVVLTPQLIVDSWGDKDAEYFWWLHDKGDIDFDAPSILIPNDKFKPFVYVRKIVERFLTEDGYFVNWQGEFTNSDDFKGLSISDNTPINTRSKFISKMWHNEMRVLGQMNFKDSGPAVVLFSGSEDYRDKNDPDNLINLVGNIFTAPATDRYKMTVHYRVGFEDPYLVDFTPANFAYIKITVRNVTDSIDEDIRLVPVFTTFGTQQQELTQSTRYMVFESVGLVSGKEYKVNYSIEYQIFGGIDGLAGSVDFYLYGAGVDFESHELELVSSSAIPDVTVYDIIKGLSGLSIIFEVDRHLDTVNIWGYDDYIAAGKTEDWTEKVIRDENIRHENIGQSKYSDINFVWKKDSSDEALSIVTDEDGKLLGNYKETINESIGDKSVKLFKGEFAPTAMRRTDSGLWMPHLILNERDDKIVPRLLVHKEGQSSRAIVTITGGGADVVTTDVPDVFFYKENASPEDFSLCFNNLHDEGLRGQSQDVGLVDRLWRNKITRFFYGRYVTVEMLLSYKDWNDSRLNHNIIINDNEYTLVKIDNYNMSRVTPTSIQLIQR